MVNYDSNEQNPESLQKHISEYDYEPLKGPDMIRTVQLHATKDRIECSLQQIRFSEGGYQALSYVWGKPEKTFQAVVLDEDGHELGFIPLTTNLQSALCDLRDAQEVQTKVFWIDQICIHQQGEEKNHQVALMGKIYQHAARVITYLGPAVEDDDEEKRGIELTGLLYRHFSMNYDLIYEARSLRAAYRVKSDFPVVQLPEELQDAFRIDEKNYIKQGWRWLLQVVYSEWSHRLWIVQEQLLNDEMAILHGHSLLPWDAIAVMVILFNLGLLPARYEHLYWQQNPLPATLARENIGSSIYNLWSTRQSQRREEGARFGSKLIDNMALHNARQCLDSRDRIFALLAISSDAVELGIIPDYSTPAGHIFLDASVRILQKGSTLISLAYASRWAGGEILYEAQSQSQDHLLQPMFPLWALRPPSIPIPFNSRFYVCHPHPITSLFNRPPRFSHDLSILILKGRVLDRISISTPVMFSPTFQGRIDDSWVQFWCQKLLNWYQVLRHLGITIKTAACFCRAIVADPTWTPTKQEGLSTEENLAFHFCSYWRRIANLLKENVDLPDFNLVSIVERLETFTHELTSTLRQAPNIATIYLSSLISRKEAEAFDSVWASYVLNGRSFCATENGRVCNAMNTVEKGDVVAAFQGADRLFILRPAEERYRFVGEAYVDGLMEGEAYAGLDPDEVDYDIELI